jgi:hypothetical protein
LRGLVRWEEAAEDSLLFPLVRGGVGVGQVFTFLVFLKRTCLAGRFGVVGSERGEVELLLWWWASKALASLSSTMPSSSSDGPPPAGAAPAASSTPLGGGVGVGAAAGV